MSSVKMVLIRKFLFLTKHTFIMSQQTHKMLGSKCSGIYWGNPKLLSPGKASKSCKGSPETGNKTRTDLRSAVTLNKDLTSITETNRLYTCIHTDDGKQLCAIINEWLRMSGSQSMRMMGIVV